MKQFGKILKFELKSYFKNKGFLGTTIFLVLVTGIVMFFPRILELFPDAGKEGATNTQEVMLIRIEDVIVEDLIEKNFSSTFANYKVDITNDSEDRIKERIVTKEAECAFVITSPTSYKYYVNNLRLNDKNTDKANEILQKIYEKATMMAMGMSPEQVEDTMNIQIVSKVENLGKDQIRNFFYTYIMIFTLYMGILMYGSMVATNVATEKSSRAMEILITSAKPTSMMFGKVISSCLAGLFQLTAIFGSSIIFYQMNKGYWGNNMIIDSVFNIPPELLAYMLLFFMLGFLLYAFMFSAVGSVVSKMEDINTMVTPITLLFVIAFVVVMTSMSSGDVDSPLMVAFSYIPFTSSMSMFTRIAMSTVPWHEILISVIILIGSTVGVGVLSAKIYRVGVLLYGTPPKIGGIIKAMWKA